MRHLSMFTMLCCCLVAALVPTSGQADAASSAKVGARPNVVLITADDMRADDLAFMPRTRALLGGRGVTFGDAISPYPLCCPARATLLTGQYAHNHQVKGNEHPYGGHKKFFEDGTERETLPVWLQRAGYTTAFMGKYLNYYNSQIPEQKATSDTYVPPGWDEWRGAVGQVHRYHCVRLNVNGRRLRRFPGSYQTDLYADMSQALVRRFARRDNPFFIWQSHLAPHRGTTPLDRNQPCGAGTDGPASPAWRHAGMFDGLPLPYSPARNEGDVTDKGTYIQGQRTREGNERLYRSRLESLQALDESVAQTFASLRAAGVLNDTVIIFTSDNGWLFAEHRLEGKKFPYEESLRVPLLVHGPGFRGGVEREQPVGLPDIPATIVDLANASSHVRLPLPGAPRNRQMDGLSLTDFAENPDHLADRAIPIEAGPMVALQQQDGKIPEWLYRGVRTSRHSYFAWHMADDTTEEEFYDLVADPYQLQSIHEQPSAELDSIKELYEQLKDCVGSECEQEVTLP